MQINKTKTETFACNRNEGTRVLKILESVLLEQFNEY